MSARRLPPLWLGVSAVASFWAAVYSVRQWIVLFAGRPIHEDVRMTYVAAQAGLRYGWPRIYDEAVLRSLSASFPPDARTIDTLLTYVNPPLLAWLFIPLTLVPEPVAYVIWTVVSVVALVLAWWLAAPYAGVARLTLLPLALGLWPVLLALYFGQPTILIVGLVAGAWWSTTKRQSTAAGLLLALATFLKPQDVLLVPLVLLAARRYRVVAVWLIGCAVLGIATILELQASGLESWSRALALGQVSATHTEYTLVHFLGVSPLTYLLWAAQALAALAVAWRRRSDTDLIYTAGILGTAAIAFHFHEADYSILVLAAWLFLRTSPPLWQRLWLLVGIGCMQLMTFGPASSQPVWDVATHAPQLVFDALWLAFLVAGALRSDRRDVEHRLTDARAPVAIPVVEHPALAAGVTDPRVADHL